MPMQPQPGTQQANTMKYFDDKTGNRWSIDLTVGHLLDIKTQLKIDLLDDGSKIPGELSSWVSILYIVLEDQIEQRGMKPKDFAKLLGGEVLQVAVDAFMGEYADFFSHLAPAKAHLVRGLWTSLKELEQAKEKIALETLGKVSFVLVESSDLTPGP